MELTDQAIVVELRQARRRRRLQKVNVFEALYRGYLTVLGVAVGIWALSNLPSDHRFLRQQVLSAAHRGPSLLGVVAAVVVVLSLRSGLRGGPLVLEAPDIQHVLLAPLARAAALRAPALQRLRTKVSGWAAAGVVAGLLASKRLPGPTLQWLACAGAAGALIGAAAAGLGLIASGRRLGRLWGFVISVVLLCWSLGDYLFHTDTSPFTWIGRVAMYPVVGGGWAWLVAAPVAAVVLAGLASVGGVSLEAAMRRASLVGQLRFALTVRDLRTVVVLSRLLAEERPRRRPIIALRPGSGRFWAVWKRDWQGLLRWPGSRLIRVLVLGAVAGASLREVWNGTTPLLLVAGIALWLIAMDADVGLAGEADHSDQSRSVPVDGGDLLLRHFPAGVAAVIIVALAGGLTGAQVGGWSLRAVQLGFVVAVPAGVAAVAASAVSTIRSVYGSASGLLAFSPEAAGFGVVVREALPPLIATAGVVPVWAARHLAKHPSMQIPAAVTWGWLPLLLAATVGMWISFRGIK